jgi:hypothetical protein
MGRDEENVVESVGFLDDAHLRVSLGGKNALYRPAAPSAKCDGGFAYSVHAVYKVAVCC